MAFSGAIHLGDIGVGNFIKAYMTAFTFQLSMHGGGELLVIDIKYPFGTGFVIPSHTGESMTQ